MRYFKLIEGNYILAIGTGGGGVEITETEYNTIMDVIHQKPPRSGDMDYRLKTDLTWEAYYSPEPEPPEDIDDTEALNIITGGE